MRKDGGDARPDRFAFDDRPVSDGHPGDIGNGVPPARRQDAGFDAEIADAGTLLGQSERGGRQEDEEGNHPLPVILRPEGLKNLLPNRREQILRGACPERKRRAQSLP